MAFFYAQLISLFFTYAYAALLIDQPFISLTETKGKLTTLTCNTVGVDLEKRPLHWYRQKSNEGLENILYIFEGKASYRPGFNTGKYKAGLISSLTIVNINEEDGAVYYCACWDRKNFGEGTQLIISNQTVKEPEVAISKSSIEDVIREGFAIYMCSLQNFFPGVIRVVWNEDDSRKDVESEQDVIDHNTDSNTYSLNSWIKVMNSDLGKMFTCKYKHEKNGDVWKNTFVSGSEYLLYQPVKEPEVTIFKSSKIEVAREGFAIYTCSLQHFFPAAIRVVWNEGDSEQEVKSQQCKIKHNTDNNTFSLSSSIKVPKYDLRKTFTCKYNQRTTKEGWKNISVSGNEYNQGIPHLNHMTYRAAQITYAGLLLKSIMYCPLLIFLKSKVKP